jgi:hypothetical protein
MKLFAYPNPFNSVVTVSVTLPRAADVRVALYDIAGKIVRILEEGRMEAGEHRVTLNANGLSSGIYFARLQSGNQSKTAKLVLLR